MGASSSISVRQVLGGFCLGFGLAAYLFGTMAVLWLRSTFIIGVSNMAVVWILLLSPGVLMLIGIAAIWKSRKTA